MAVRKAVSAATTTFTAISMNRFFIFLPFSCAPCGAQASKARSPFLLSYLFTFKRPFYLFTFKLSLSGLLLQDPVIKRSDLLDVLLLGGILLLRSQIDLLLHTVGGEGALVLEGYRGDLVLGGSLGLEADVDTLLVSSNPVAAL